MDCENNLIESDELGYPVLETTVKGPPASIAPPELYNTPHTDIDCGPYIFSLSEGLDKDLGDFLAMSEDTGEVTIDT